MLSKNELMPNGKPFYAMRLAGWMNQKATAQEFLGLVQKK
jgi:hypothetical protein